MSANLSRAGPDSFLVVFFVTRAPGAEGDGKGEGRNLLESSSSRQTLRVMKNRLNIDYWERVRCVTY